MAKITGIVTIKVDGQILRSKDGAKLALGGEEKTAQTGFKVFGFSSKVVPGEVEFTLAHVGGDDLRGLSDAEDVTVEFETDTGDTYMVANATCINPAELTGGEGDVSLTYQGDPAVLV